MTAADRTGVAGAGLRSGQVATAAGVNVETLRYYERRGLLPDPGRSPGGHRRYDEGSVTTLRVIKAAQRLGFTLDEVADLLEVGRHHHRARGRDAGLQARATTKPAEVEERIADLTSIRDNLRAALDARVLRPGGVRRRRLLPHPVRHSHRAPRSAGACHALSGRCRADQRFFPSRNSASAFSIRR